MMFIIFDTTTSADETMDAIEDIRALAGKQCFLSGMSAIVTDTKNLAESEVAIYVLIAVVLSCIVLALTMESYLIPVFFLLSIGMAIIYNMGSNIFMGQISYITKAAECSPSAGCYDGATRSSCGTAIRNREKKAKRIIKRRWQRQSQLRSNP